MDAEEIASLFRVTPSTVRGWVRDGMPCTVHGKKGAGHKHQIDIDAATTWYFRVNASRLALIRSKTRLARELADRLQHENQERRRDLCSLELWQREVGRMMDETRRVLLAIPAAEAKALQGVHDVATIHAHLTDTIHAALRKLAGPA